MISIKYLCLIPIVFTSLLSKGQNLEYSYTDPCTGIVKNVSVPQGGITITYFGQIKTFTPDEFNNGNFQKWTNNILSSLGMGNPCGSILGVSQTVDIAQSSAQNLISLVYNLSALTEIKGSMNINTTRGLESMKSKSNKKQRGSKKGEESYIFDPTEGIENRETMNSEESSGDAKINVLGGSIQSVDKLSDNKKPQVVISSDFSGFNFRDKDVTFGGKGTGGYTSLNWDGTKSWGLLFDWTSQIRGPNVTGFYAFIGERMTNIVSLTGTRSFLGRGSTYGTLAVGQMWSFYSIKNFKTIYLLTMSFGDVYGEPFIGTAFVSGTTYDRKLSKRWEIKLMNLFIYAPYVSYYNDIVLKSPYIIMPIVGTNLLITPKFKLNLNFGSTYALNKNVMNFTLMFGTRLGI